MWIEADFSFNPFAWKIGRFISSAAHTYFSRVFLFRVLYSCQKCPGWHTTREALCKYILVHQCILAVLQWQRRRYFAANWRVCDTLQKSLMDFLESLILMTRILHPLENQLQKNLITFFFPETKIWWRSSHVKDAQGNDRLDKSLLISWDEKILTSLVVTKDFFFPLLLL